MEDRNLSLSVTQSHPQETFESTTWKIGDTGKTNDDREIILELPSPVVNKQYFNICKTANVMATTLHKEIEDTINDHICLADVPFKIGIKKNIINTLNLYNEESIELSKNTVTQFDMAVMDAVYTIINCGFRFPFNDEFIMVTTTEWIAKVIAGHEDYRPTKAMTKKIDDSIEKLRHIFIKIDCTQEFESRKDTKNEHSIFDGYLLPIEVLKVGKDKKLVYKSNHKEVKKLYCIIKKPILYTYAEIINQIIDVPVNILEAHHDFKETEFSIPIKRHVIKRVFQIINSKNRLNSNRISFEWQDGVKTKGLYAELGIKPDNTKKWRTKTKPLIVKVVKETLMILKNSGIITDFSPYRSDGTGNHASPVAGFEISYKSKKAA